MWPRIHAKDARQILVGKVCVQPEAGQSSTATSQASWLESHCHLGMRTQTVQSHPPCSQQGAYLNDASCNRGSVAFVVLHTKKAPSLTPSCQQAKRLLGLWAQRTLASQRLRRI